MTTRFPNGLTTAAKTTPFGEFILPDMTKAHTYMNDFDNYVANDWLVTEVGAATQQLADADGGVLIITNAAADDDSSFNQKVGESYLFATGKKLWFDCLFQVNDATQSEFIIGLQIADSSPLDVTDGVFFIKADGVDTIDLLVEKDNVSTTTSAVATVTDATNIRLSYFYNGIDRIDIFVNGVIAGSSVTTNLPDDEELTISFGIQNGEAVAKSMRVDYIMASKER